MHPLPRTPDHSQEICDVRQWMNVAGLARVDCSDWHPLQIKVAFLTSDQHLDFKLKTLLIALKHRLHKISAEQAIARLVIGNGLPHRPTE